jgi:hypothetical protein
MRITQVTLVSWPKPLRVLRIPANPDRKTLKSPAAKNTSRASKMYQMNKAPETRAIMPRALSKISRMSLGLLRAVFAGT